MKSLTSAIEGYVKDKEASRKQRDDEKKTLEKTAEEAPNFQSYFKNILESAIVTFKKEYYSRLDVGDAIQVKDSVLKELAKGSGFTDPSGKGYVESLETVGNSEYKLASVKFSNLTVCAVESKDVDILKKAWDPFVLLEFKDIITKPIENGESYKNARYELSKFLITSPTNNPVLARKIHDEFFNILENQEILSDLDESFRLDISKLYKISLPDIYIKTDNNCPLDYANVRLRSSYHSGSGCSGSGSYTDYHVYINGKTLDGQGFQYKSRHDYRSDADANLKARLAELEAIVSHINKEAD